jgi:hypothetical protein
MLAMAVLMASMRMAPLFGPGPLGFPTKGRFSRAVVSDETHRHVWNLICIGGGKGLICRRCLRGQFPTRPASSVSRSISRLAGRVPPKVWPARLVAGRAFVCNLSEAERALGIAGACAPRSPRRRGWAILEIVFAGGVRPNATRTRERTPGLFPGLCAGFPGFLPLFDRFSFASRRCATVKKAYICWGFSGRSGRI